jgi:hypothetical protein
MLGSNNVGANGCTLGNTSNGALPAAAAAQRAGLVCERHDCNEPYKEAQIANLLAHWGA